MANEREIAFAITASDQASKVLDSVQKEAEASGKGISEALKDATSSSERFEKAQAKVRDWVKENVREQRIYRGVLNEVRDVVGASGIALAAFGMAAGGAESATRQMSNALNQGYAAFQGIDAVIGMVGMGGPWGLAIAAIGGVAAGLLSMGQAAEVDVQKMGELNLKIADQAFALGDLSAKQMEGAYLSALAALIKKQVELTGQTQTFGTVMKTLWGFFTGDIRMGDPAITQIAGSPEEIANIQVAIQSLHQEMKGFYETQAAASGEHFDTAQRLAVSQTRFIAEEEQKRYDAQIAFHELLTADEATRHLMVMKNSDAALKKITWNLKLMAKASLDTGAMLAESTSTFLTDNADLVRNIYASLTSSVREMWENVFTGTEAVARKLFKSILLSVIDLAQGLLMAALVVAQAKGILTFFASIASDLALLAAATVGLQLLRGFVASQFHSGGVVPKNGGAYFDAPSSREFPILVRGGETVRTESQEAALRTGSGTTVIVNINAPVDRIEYVRQAVEDGLRATGLTSIDRFFRNDNYELALIGTQ